VDARTFLCILKAIPEGANNVMQEIYYITSHILKAEQISLHLNYPIRHKSLDLPEIQSLDVVEVAIHKAKTAFEAVGRTVLVEDISFTFEALGNLPGPFIKWFLQELKVQGICELLSGYDNRRARGHVVFVLYDGIEVRSFEGERLGQIAEQPIGEDGFGMDSIFIPQDCSKTWGEMGKEEQEKTSMRRIALKKLEEFLKSK